MESTILQPVGIYHTADGGLISNPYDFMCVL